MEFNDFILSAHANPDGERLHVQGVQVNPASDSRVRGVQDVKAVIQLEPVEYIRAFASPDRVLRFKDEHLTTRLRETPGTAQPGQA